MSDVPKDTPEAITARDGVSDVPALILEELRAIRALLERQLSIQAWFAGLQIDPFSPSPVDLARAAEEARFVAEEAKQRFAFASSAGRAQQSDSAQSPLAPCDCSGCSGCVAP